MKHNEKGQFENTDYTGRRIGYFTVLSDTQVVDKEKGRLWVAQCDCGKKFLIGSNRMSKRRSCGCKSLVNDGQFQADDITGEVVKNIKAVRQTEIRNNGYVVYVAECEFCGKQKEVPSYYFKRGHVSCDCSQWKALYTKQKGRRIIPNNFSNKKSYFAKYKRAAEKRGLGFELSENEFEQLTTKECYYCGSPPRQIRPNGTKREEFYRNGIDRKNNEIGYVITNCVPCCKTCNFAKGTMNESEFKEWVFNTYHFLFNKGGDTK